MLARAKNLDEAVAEFKKLRDPEISENNGVFINGNGYEAKVVDESRLLAHVEKGWDVVKELKDGRFILRKQNGT